MSLSALTGPAIRGSINILLIYQFGWTNGLLYIFAYYAAISFIVKYILGLHPCNVVEELWLSDRRFTILCAIEFNKFDAEVFREQFIRRGRIFKRMRSYVTEILGQHYYKELTKKKFEDSLSTIV